MTVVFTDPALADLEDIITYTKQYYPNQLLKLDARIAVVISRIEQYPKSATATFRDRDVRVVPLIHYPFRIFYREIPGGVEILHIRHSARKAP